MENVHKKTVALKEIYPMIKEKIDGGGVVKLPITGTSMLPLLVWGRDTVVLVKCEAPKIGDIIFYLRDNGQFVLHRIVDVDEKGYILCGDNQWNLEYGIQDRHIIAVVTSITRKGKTFDVTKNIPYRIYSSLWMALLPVRKFIIPAVRDLKYRVKKCLKKLKIIK